jgi:hypothetical protein
MNAELTKGRSKAPQNVPVVHVLRMHIEQREAGQLCVLTCCVVPAWTSLADASSHPAAAAAWHTEGAELLHPNRQTCGASLCSLIHAALNVR